MPPSARVETAKENADRGSEEIRENLGFLQTVLLVFGFVAVFVGAFLIFNTFSITVAQRVAEFGLLRTLGASRRQILASVVFEALADRPGRSADRHPRRLPRRRRCLNALFKAIGFDLPTTGLVMESRTVVVSLLVGIVVTLRLGAGAGAALDPGAADRRPAGLRPAGQPPPPARLRRRSRCCSALGGLAVLLLGLFGSGSAGTRAGLMGAGAVAIVLAVSLFSPRLVPPLAAIAGWPLERLRRLTGRLARENAQRNPSRTAVTAAALMIGLALVTFVTVFAAGLKSSVAQVIDENFAGGLVIQNTNGFSPIPPARPPPRARVPGVDIGGDGALDRSEAARQRRQVADQRPDPRHRSRRQRRMEAGGAGDRAQPERRRRRSSRTPSPPTTASKSATASAC